MAYPDKVTTFARRVFLFCLPLLLAAALLESLLWSRGESWPLSKVVTHQRHQSEFTFMRAFFDQAITGYKFKTLGQRRPDILIVGSSRVGKFRYEMFGVRPEQFYNGSLLISSLADLDNLLTHLPADFHPKLIVLNLDPWWLNDNYHERSPQEFAATLEKEAVSDWKAHLTCVRSLLADPKFLYAELRNLPKCGPTLGMGAHRVLEAYRSDGSLKGFRPAPAPGDAFQDRIHPPILNRIRRGVLFFEFAEHLSPTRLSRMRSTLTRLKERTDLLIAFGPPLFDRGWEQLLQDPRQAQFWKEYRSQLPVVFAELGIPYADCSSPALLGVDDRYMLDGTHGEEVITAHVMLKLLEFPELNSALPGALQATRAALASPGTNLWYLDFPR